MSAKRKVSLAVVIVTAFITGIFFTTMGSNLLGSNNLLSRSYAGTTEVNTQSATSPADLETAFTEVSETINPTVVQIRSERVTEGRRQNPFQGTPFEEFFGGPGNNSPRRSQGLGSGVIIQEDGYIVTNNHVVEGADELEVFLADGSSYAGEIVGTDPYSDLAVVRINAEGLPAISFGNSDNIRTGQWVLAFGSPLDQRLSNTVTAGIVSAVGRLRGANEFRRGPAQGGQGQSVTGVRNFIQTDAAINPGNSGGPLVNLQGQLIGINSAIMSQSGGYQGIGFAIPVNTVKDVADQLIESGEVQRARLGVEYDGASQSVIEALDMPRGTALVGRVVPGSAADEAGIQAGDFIVAINGEELTNSLQLGQIIGRMKPGEEVEITINRDGEEETLTATLGGATTEAVASSEEDEASSSSQEQMMEELGFAVSDLTPQLKQRLRVEGEVDGVVITQVDPASDVAREAQIGRGAIITEAARQPVTSVADFQEIYEATEAGDYILLKLRLPTQDGRLTTTTTAVRKTE